MARGKGGPTSYLCVHNLELSRATTWLAIGRANKRNEARAKEHFDDTARPILPAVHLAKWLCVGDGVALACPNRDAGSILVERDTQKV